MFIKTGQNVIYGWICKYLHIDPSLGNYVQ